MKPSKAVKEFHLVYQIPWAHISDQKALALRLKLITEEYNEVVRAADSLLFLDQTSSSRQNFLKELADLVYVIYGTAETFGYNLDEAFTRVHASNMSKLNEDGEPTYREDGKVLKGPNYKEPDLGDLV
jgi:predicted HAD superfamily Cof-like phosphohydrolase